MRSRSQEKEYIDLGSEFYTKEEYRDCLKKLGSVGRLLGGNLATLSAFKKLKHEPTTILDVGCGGGDFTRLLAKKYPQAEVVGIDYSKAAIEYAKEQPQNVKLPNLTFKVPDTLELNAPLKSFDVVTATLVCHHMTDQELVDFLVRAANVARKAIILNDLHRHPLAYLSYFILNPILFRNRLITHDGLLSIKRSFTRSDWISYLHKAGFKEYQYTIKWKFPFRWIITINP